MVDDSISVYSDTSSSAGLNHVSEFVPVSVSAIKFVRYWLVHEVPRVELSVLGPLVGEEGLVGREDLDSHPSHLSQLGTFIFNVSVGPPE